jgi:hypothetical protein
MKIAKNHIACLILDAYQNVEDPVTGGSLD